MLQRRLDALELVLFSGFAAPLAGVAVITIEPARPSTLTYADYETEAYYEARFGKTPRSSVRAEEWLIRDFFRDRRDGVFVDVGASHFRDNSNTYFLETSLGSSGLVIDAQAQYAAGYEQDRPRTRYITAFVSDHSDAPMSFFIPPSEMLGHSLSH